MSVNVVCLNCRSAMSVESVLVFIRLSGQQTTHTRLMAVTLIISLSIKLIFYITKKIFSCTIFLE